MNTGTFYLYEYENNKRRRNVGFIKTARHYRSCILQIHAAGIPAGNGASLELYAFYRDDRDLIAEQIAVLNCFRRNISARLPISETAFPEGRSPGADQRVSDLSAGSRHPLFWMASDLFFDVDISRTRIPSREASRPDVRAAEEPEISETPETPAQPGVSVQTETPAQPEAPAQTETPAQNEAPAQTETLIEPEARSGLKYRLSLPRKRSSAQILPGFLGDSGRLQTTAFCSTVPQLQSSHADRRRRAHMAWGSRHLCSSRSTCSRSIRIPKDLPAPLPPSLSLPRRNAATAAISGIGAAA